MLKVLLGISVVIAGVCYCGYQRAMDSAMEEVARYESLKQAANDYLGIEE